MGVFKFLFLIGFFTSTNGQWCDVKECPRKVELHCGDSSYSNCAYKSSNYCMVKIQECARMERGYPKFNVIMKGECFTDRPPCREFKRVKRPKARSGPRPRPEPSARTKATTPPETKEKELNTTLKKELNTTSVV